MDKEKGKGQAKGKGKGEDRSETEEAANATGKPEVHKHGDKTSMAVAVLKIALTTPGSDTDSNAFGSAKLMLKIVGNKEPTLRAQINVVTEQKPAGTLTACLNGESIGELTTPGSDEKKKIAGHLKTTIPNPSIQLPGVTVDIVDGTCNGGTKILSGRI
jgi:hypothetical protein